MSGSRTVLVAGAVALALIMAAPRSAAAQAWGYPAWQPSNLTTREFNFGVAGGDPGTSGVFQWREGVGPLTNFNLDIGVASPGHGADTRFLIGGGFVQQLLRASKDTPIDLLLTAGIYGSFAGRSLGRIPVGVVVGHRFATESPQVFVTPYVHPRLSIDFASRSTQLNVNFDIGTDVQFTPTLSLRPALSIGSVGESGSDVAFGLSLAVRPTPLGGR